MKLKRDYKALTLSNVILLIMSFSPTKKTNESVNVNLIKFQNFLEDSQ